MCRVKHCEARTSNVCGSFQQYMSVPHTGQADLQWKSVEDGLGCMFVLDVGWVSGQQMTLGVLPHFRISLMLF